MSDGEIIKRLDALIAITRLAHAEKLDAARERSSPTRRTSRSSTIRRTGRLRASFRRP